LLKAEAVKQLAEAFSSMTFDQLGKAAEALHALKVVSAQDAKDADQAIAGLKAITKILSEF
jgi:hypothetical protein